MTNPREDGIPEEVRKAITKLWAERMLPDKRIEREVRRIAL